MFKYTLPELFELRACADLLRKLEKPEDVLPLTDELLTILVTRAKHNIAVWGKNDPNTIFIQSGGDACCCTGPTDGEPVCGCRMSILAYTYRYDIAIKLHLESMNISSSHL